MEIMRTVLQFRMLIAYASFQNRKRWRKKNLSAVFGIASCAKFAAIYQYKLAI
jgi:hypothetical protein